MNLPVLFFLDRLLGGFLLLLLKLFPLSKRNLPDNIEKIIVLKFFGNGSLILAAPSLYALKCRYPSAKMILYTVGNKDDLNKILKIFDDIILLDTSRPFTALFKLLKLRKSCLKSKSMLLNFELHSRFAIFLTGFLRGSFSLSLSYKNCSAADKTIIPEKQTMPELYDSIAHFAGGKVDKKAYTGFLLKNSPDIIPKRQLIIAPFCSKLSLRRQWDFEKWSELLAKFCAEYPDFFVAVIGTACNRKNADQIIARSGCSTEKIHNYCGEITLSILWDLLRESECFCGIDSAPLHLARSAEIPAVSLWGATEPMYFRRVDEKSPEVILSGCRECSPCVHTDKKCRYQKWCINTITPDLVFQSIVEINSKKITDCKKISVSDNKEVL